MPPSSTRPATPISTEQLQQRLSKPQGQPVVRDETPPPVQQVTTVEPDPNKQAKLDTSKPLMKGLMDNLNKSMDEKKSASAAEGKSAKKEDIPPEKKAVVSSEDAPPVKKDATVSPKPLTDAELGVQPHDSERTRLRITTLNAEKNRVAAEKAAIQKELEDLRKAPKTEANAEEMAKLKEEHQKLQDEATRLRRRYDWDNDTEAKVKYREPIALAEKSVEDAFRKNGFEDPTLKAIKDAGGFAAFSRSQATYPIEVADAEAEGGKKVVNYTAAELARSWLSRMPIADAELIRQSVGRQELLQSEEKAAISKAQDDAKNYYEGQTKAQREAQATSEATNKRLADEYTAWSTKTEGETEWLKDRPVPENATEEQKTKIEEYNTTQKDLRESLKKHPTTALEYGQLKLDAARSHHLDRTMAEKDAEIERLTGELKRKAAAQKTTGKGGSLLVKDGHKPDEEKKAVGDTNFMGRINAAMEKKRGGGDDE